MDQESLSQVQGTQHGSRPQSGKEALRPQSGKSSRSLDSSITFSIESVGTPKSGYSLSGSALGETVAQIVDRPVSGVSQSSSSAAFSVASVGTSSSTGSVVNAAMRQVMPDTVERPIQSRGSLAFSLESVGTRSSTAASSLANRTALEITAQVSGRPVSAQSAIAAVSSVGTPSSVGAGFTQEALGQFVDSAVDKAVENLVDASEHAHDSSQDIVETRRDSDGKAQRTGKRKKDTYSLVDGDVPDSDGTEIAAALQPYQELASTVPVELEEFEVFLRKGPTDKLGWTRQGGRILTVKEGGLIDQWNVANASNPSLHVLQGDHLVSVNGISLEQEKEVLEQLQRATSLYLCFKRRTQMDAQISAQKLSKHKKALEQAHFDHEVYPLFVVVKIQACFRAAQVRHHLRKLENACILVQRQYRARMVSQFIKSSADEDPLMGFQAPDDGGLPDEPRMFEGPPHVDATSFCLRRRGTVSVDDQVPLEMPLLVTTFIGGDRAMLRHCDLHVNNQNLPAIFCRIEASKRSGEIKANFARGPFPEDVVAPAVKPVVSITITPWAGSVGLEVNASGDVQHVEPGSQAAIAGIKRRWRLKSVHGAPVVCADAAGGIPKALQAPSLLKRTVSKGKTFSLQFEVDGPSASDAINKRGEATLCVGSRLRFGHTWWELVWKKTLLYVDPAVLDSLQRCNTWGDLERTTLDAGRLRSGAIREIELLASSEAGEVVLHISSASPEAPALRGIRSLAKVGDVLRFSVISRVTSEPPALPQPALLPAAKWPQTIAFKMMRSSLSSPELRPGGPRAPKKYKPRLLEPLPRPGKPGSLLPGNASYWPSGCAPDFCRFEKPENVNPEARVFALF